MPDDLARLLEASRPREMSASGKEAQRRSFAYGNTAIENPLVTRETVDEEASKLARKATGVTAALPSEMGRRQASLRRKATDVATAPDEPSRPHSVASAAELITDPIARAEAEARSGILQFDLGLRIVEDALAEGKEFRWRPSAILALHREAL
jgi:hypothetical protein